MRYSPQTGLATRAVKIPRLNIIVGTVKIKRDRKSIAVYIEILDNIPFDPWMEKYPKLFVFGLGIASPFGCILVTIWR
jgi:hypothetical protein